MEVKINIAVTGTGSLIGQAIIKSMKKSCLTNEIRIVGCDYFSNTVGSFWCDQNYILPDILKEENRVQWRHDIFKIITEESISILFVGVDFELMLFAGLKDEIEESTGCVVIVSNKRVLEIGNDKYLTYEFLKSIDLNYPETWLPDEMDQAEIEFPCILKPRVGARSKGVYVVKSKGDLLNKLPLVDGPVIQKLIGNNNSEYTCSVLCVDNKMVDSIVLHRYLKEGNTHLAEYRKYFKQNIYDYIKEIAIKLQPYGSCNLQLRLDNDQEPYLFEINPRFSGTTYMRSLLGFNEVEFMIKYVSGYHIEPFHLKEGKILRYYEEVLLENKS